jgi:hypothetical protein
MPFHYYFRNQVAKQPKQAASPTPSLNERLKSAAKAAETPEEVRRKQKFIASVTAYSDYYESLKAVKAGTSLLAQAGDRFLANPTTQNHLHLLRIGQIIENTTNQSEKLGQNLNQMIQNRSTASPDSKSSKSLFVIQE